MTRELKSTREASGIEWPASSYHIPCMAHVMQLAFGGVMSSLGVKGLTKSWEAHERNRQFGEDQSIEIGNSHGLRKEGHARISKVSAMRPGLAKMIEKVHISWYFESPQADLHIAENACGIDYADTWSPKRGQWLAKAKSGFQYFRLWMWRHIGIEHWSCSGMPTDYGNSHESGSNTQNPVITCHYSQLKINRPLWSMSWKYWGHFDIGPCGCRRTLQWHCITLS